MQGGKRLNSGRKKGEETDNMTFRVPKSQKEKAIEHFGKKLNSMFKDWLNELLKDKE